MGVWNSKIGHVALTTPLSGRLCHRQAGHVGDKATSTFCQSDMVSIGISKLGPMDLIFVDPEAKISGGYYRDMRRHSKTDVDGVILGVRMRRPSWTPCWITSFCPTSGMSTQVYLKSPMGPLQGSRVKIRGHTIAHRTPSATGLLWKQLLPGDARRVRRLLRLSTRQHTCTSDTRYCAISWAVNTRFHSSRSAAITDLNLSITRYGLNENISRRWTSLTNWRSVCWTFVMAWTRASLTMQLLTRGVGLSIFERVCVGKKWTLWANAIANLKCFVAADTRDLISMVTFTFTMRRHLIRLASAPFISSRLATFGWVRFPNFPNAIPSL